MAQRTLNGSNTESMAQKESNPAPVGLKRDVSAQIIRAAVNTVYDIQQLRISTGNRLYQSFTQQASILPETTTDSVDTDAKAMIAELVKEYKIITEVYVDLFNGRGHVEKAIKHIGSTLVNIQTENQYTMTSIYVELLKQEQKAVKLVDREVKNHPMWDAFFQDVVGCGPLMSAVCLSRLDPYKARHRSGFWKYSGLDVVWEPAKPVDGFMAANDDINPDDDPTAAAEISTVAGADMNMVMMTKHVQIFWDDDRAPFDSDVITAVAEDDYIEILLPGMKFQFQMKEKDTVIRPTKKNGLTEPQVIPGAKIIDFNIVDLPTKYSVDNGHFVGRSLRHTVMTEYINRNGETCTKKSITYCPFLKAKLMGVLADSFIKCPGSKYEQVYRNYRARLDNEPAHYGKTAAHKHMMAKRYAVKQFLSDMWVAWRTLEGLPVSDTYAVDKLGMAPHGFNY